MNLLLQSLYELFEALKFWLHGLSVESLSLADCLKNTFICVSKMNVILTGLEQHESENFHLGELYHLNFISLTLIDFQDDALKTSQYRCPEYL